MITMELTYAKYAICSMKDGSFIERKDEKA